MGITKLYAGVEGDPLNSSGPQIRDTVNQLIEAHVNSLKTLPTAANAQTDTIYNVIGFYANTQLGGGRFIWNPTANKSTHNGGTVIAPEAIAAWNGTQADIATLLNWTGSGSGCWVRSDLQGFVTPEMFGAVGDGVSVDVASVQKSLNSAESQVSLSGQYLLTSSGFYCLELNGISNLKIIGVSRATKLKVANMQSAGVLNIINCNNLSLIGFEIDGNATNASVIIGVHGIRTNNVDGLDISQMIVRDTHSYGIGFQEGYSRNINIDKTTIIDAGGDGIDFKDHTGTNKAIKISNLYVENHSKLQAGKPAVDIRGKATLSNIHVKMLTVNSIGVRFRESDGGATGFGSKRSSLVGFIIDGSTLSGTQGVVSADGDISISCGDVFDVSSVGLQAIGSNLKVSDVSVTGGASCLNFDFSTASSGGAYLNLKSFVGSTGFRINCDNSVFMGCQHSGGTFGFRRSTGSGVNTLIGCNSYDAATSDFSSASDIALNCDFETSTSPQYLTINRNPVIRMNRNDTGVNHLSVTAGSSGLPPTLSPAGADANCDLQLSGRGTGKVRFGVLTASADAPVTGYIEIKDASGTIRKLAVIA